MSGNDQRPFDGRHHGEPRPATAGAHADRSRRRSLRWALSTLGLALLFGLAAGLVPAAPVSANGPGANGCTGVPDTGPGFAFHGPCDNHDRCYRAHHYGDGSSGRRTCDRVFRTEMLRHCRRYGFGLRRAVCRATAHLYHAGVRSLGAPFWALHRPAPIG